MLYSSLTGDNNCIPSGLSQQEIDQQLAEAGPSLFDPLPFLQNMENPGLWIFAENDLSVPVTQSVAILDSLIIQDEKPFSYIIIPNANHAWIIDGEICQEQGTVADLLPQIFEWISQNI